MYAVGHKILCPYIRKNNNLTIISMIKLGVFGFGCVGQGLYDVLQRTNGIKAEIVKICVKNKNKERSLPAELFTFDKNDLLNHPDINVIVELIDDAEAAYEIVTTALKNKKAVVTANKKMLAEHFEELFCLQLEHGVPLLYEGACCASIPIIRNLEEYYDNDLLNSVEGIFNGSTNYILTKIFRDNLSFDAALKQAQELGFAESDPRLDIEAFDPKFKLSIVLTHAFGIFVKPENIFHYGIQNLSDFDIRYAREKGYKIKLVASCRKEGDKIYAAVLPKFVLPDDRLYNIDYEYNGITIESIFSEDQFFAGKGAGSYPTGSAVLSDISALTYDYKYEYKKFFQQNTFSLDNNFAIEVYIRYKNGISFPADDFITIRENYSSVSDSYLIGSISLDSLIKAEWLRDENVNIVLLPDFLPAFIKEKVLGQELVMV
jgi:homoserine dehydrogenase